MPSLSPAETDQFVEQMRPALVKFFWRKCRTQAEAEDLAQDVLMRALDYARHLPAGQAKGYIFRAAVNRWRDRQRRIVSRGTTVELNESLLSVDEQSVPERLSIAEQELRLVMESLMELSERTRDVFVLVRLEQMKQTEIAAMFQISVSAVEKHLARAIAHLSMRAGGEGSRS
jgi:RNA polymerase sigma-70 factor (ECF subfamily)